MAQGFSAEPGGAVGDGGHGEPRTPICRMAMTSGTLDIPTALAPRALKTRISAGVS